MIKGEDRKYIKSKIEEVINLIDLNIIEEQKSNFQIEPDDLPTEDDVKRKIKKKKGQPSDKVEKVDELDLVPDEFPINGIETVIYNVIQMSLTESLSKLSDDLQERYLELDGLILDIQLRLLGVFATPELIAKASKKMTELIEFGRKREKSDSGSQS
jgi:hypothetical protein